MLAFFIISIRLRRQTFTHHRARLRDGAGDTKCAQRGSRSDRLVSGKALYSAEREKMSSDINQNIVAAIEPRGIVVERMLLRDVALPPRLQQAIQEKLSAEQEASRMQFVLLKEKQEAERKKIEAEGISSFQKIVTEGINENLLKWKGIEATKELALSGNTKIVIIGAGKEGLPIILGGDASTSGQPRTPQPSGH